MGVGKTTFGKKLASALQLPFIDTDKLVEEYANASIEQIFDTKGESAFRKMEADVLRNIKETTIYVVSTGGGLPCFYDNMAFMNKHGFTIYLNANSAFIYSRLIGAKKSRPLIKSLNKDELLAFIEQKISDRSPYYMLSRMEIKLPVKTGENLIESAVSAYRQYQLPH